MSVRTRVNTTIVPMLLTLIAQNTQAAGKIELGGKRSFSILAAFNAESQFASAILVGSADFSYITPSGRYEAGAGIRAVGLLAGPAVLAAYLPYVTVRLNSRLFGAEQNMLFYTGINLGVTIFTIDVKDDDKTATGFAGGLRLGYEYYFTPTVAIRIDNTLTISDGFEDSVAVGNTFSIGTRFLF